MEQEKHSEFGGSSASRWLNCPGSVALARTVPERRKSDYAAEGTLAHALAEHCLTNGEYTTAQFIGMTLDGRLDAPTFSEDMCNAVQVYLDAVYDEMSLHSDAELYVEQSFALPISCAEPGEVFGRNDAMIYVPSKKRLVLYDYKHGAGVSVSATDNAQAKFYATGALLAHGDWPIGEVVIRIVQPRARDVAANGAVREWAMDPLTVLDFLGECETAIATAKADGAPVLASGDWCRWCPAAPACPVVEQNFMKAAQLDLAGVADVTPKRLPAVKDLDLARIGATLAAADALEGWLEKLREFAFGLLESGVAVPGFKLVEKMARRKWIDNGDEIAAYLEMMHGLEGEQIYPRKIATITEVERALAARYADKAERKAACDELSLKYTVKESSGRTLAPTSDKRPAVSVAADYQTVNL